MRKRHEVAATERHGNFFAASLRPDAAASPVCPACGARARREDAKFCLVYGKYLMEDYKPLDALRASYRLQGKSFLAENRQIEETPNLFEQNENSAAQSAKALVVYSLVPYLGILFCPFALLSGSIGAFVSFRQLKMGGGRASVYSIVSTFIIFAVQIFLWWLLYF